jgi:His-Xaa-Ser system protein HxsD
MGNKLNQYSIMEEQIKFPVFELDNNKIKVVVSLGVYSKEALTVALYAYTSTYYIHQSLADDKTIEVFFESKDKTLITVDIVKQFCNALIDQQFRYNTNLQFGHIRDLIVEEAFKPVNTQND